MVAVLGYTKEQIREAVKDMYTMVANDPTMPLHFPIGHNACKLAGYSDTLINGVPNKTLESFAGVGCPFAADVINEGQVVLDIGAGSGTDVIIAGKLVGDTGKVWALDLTPAMRNKLNEILTENQITNVQSIEGDAENIPLPDQSVDVVTSNGVLNLVANKRLAIREIFRVLKPGGYAQIADIVIASPVTPDCEDDPKLWAECVVGATVDENYLHMFRDAGFEDLKIIRDYDYFAHSPSEETKEVASQFGAHALELKMRRGHEEPSKINQWLKRMQPKRIIADLRRRGLMGMCSLVLALITCYGTLGLVAMMSALGVTMAVNTGIWAGTIILFALLTTVIIAIGIRKHRALTPFFLSLVGMSVLIYTMYFNYSILIEMTGFFFLAAAVYYDYRLRRWANVSDDRKKLLKD